MDTAQSSINFVEKIYSLIPRKAHSSAEGKRLVFSALGWFRTQSVQLSFFAASVSHKRCWNPGLKKSHASDRNVLNPTKSRIAVYP